MKSICSNCHQEKEYLIKGMCPPCYAHGWYLKHRIESLKKFKSPQSKEQKRAYYQKNKNRLKAKALERYYSDSSYRKKNIERANIASELRRFGQSKAEITQLLGSKCSLCKITNKAHLKKFNRTLCIHHIDGTGCHDYDRQRKIEPNNKLKNLQLMCISCHARLHNTK